MRGVARLVTLSSLVAFCACHEAAEEVPLVWKYQATAPSAASPLVTVNYVAMPTDAGVAVVGLNGEPRCFFDAHGAVRATPRSNGQLLFVGSSTGIVYAVDATCNVVWKYVTGEGIVGDAALAGGTLFVAGYEGHVFALAAETGALNWSFPASPVPSPPVVAAAEPAAEVGAHGKKMKGKKMKGKKAKGKAHGKDARAQVAAPAPAPAPVAAAPAAPAGADHVATSGVSVADGVVYFGGRDHNVYALNAADGGLRWRFETEGLVTATPHISDGLVYVGSQDGGLYAIRSGDHTLAWKLTTQDRITATTRIFNHVAYVGSQDKHLYAADPVKGAVRWKVETQSPVVAAASAYKATIVLVEANGTVQLIAGGEKDAKVVWKHAFHVPMSAAPVISDERLYLSGSDGILRAIALNQLTLGT